MIKFSLDALLKIVNDLDNKARLKNKLCRPENQLGLSEDDPYIVYETDLLARLRWKRPDLCFACAGYGRIASIDLFAQKYYKKCALCNGSGWTKDHLTYNSGHREI